MFKLLNREFAFDADMSELECGMNGAIYLVEMEADTGTKYRHTHMDPRCWGRVLSSQALGRAFCICKRRAKKQKW